MRTPALALVLAGSFALTACGKLKGGDGDAKEDPSSGGGGVQFAGQYQSNWGPTTFTQSGNVVSATYGRGSMTCNASGSALDCNWTEGSMKGKAKLAKEADGSIKGTWGNGTSATDGGPWVFTLVGAAGATAPAGAVDFSGTYKSTWGPTTFVQDGNRVTAKYPNGNMKCVATGNVLDCDWVEGSTFGKAKLTKQPDGRLVGTWGNGGSSTNGGQWIFFR